jgi:hypothetical protein
LANAPSSHLFLRPSPVRRVDLTIVSLSPACACFLLVCVCLPCTCAWMCARCVDVALIRRHCVAWSDGQRRWANSSLIGVGIPPSVSPGGQPQRNALCHVTCTSPAVTCSHTLPLCLSGCPFHSKCSPTSVICIYIGLLIYLQLITCASSLVKSLLCLFA